MFDPARFSCELHKEQTINKKLFSADTKETDAGGMIPPTPPQRFKKSLQSHI
jgi:hypothetical protein